MKNKNSNIKGTVVLLVLILMLMVVLIYVNNRNSISASGSKNIKSLALLGQLEAQDKNSSILSVDDFLAEAAGAVIHVRNIEGEPVWSKTLNGKIVSMKYAAGNLYVLDSSKRLYCISKSGIQLWDKQLE
ncbi:MAG TPA: hypothetical protein VEF53_05920, partial [Patescibacteria group bacterium]|nr:hypothetical protein [Patescibacteria group bacterium]